MGWTGDNELWVSTRGGDVLVAPQPGVTERFDNANVPSRGFGILDVGCAPLSSCNHRGGLAYPFVSEAGAPALTMRFLLSNLSPAAPCRFLNKDLGFACGGSGSLFKTENGGKTWKREKVPS